MNYLIVIILLSCCSTGAFSNEYGWKYDIANIPPKYQTDFEMALESWQKLKKIEQKLYKLSTYGRMNHPFGWVKVNDLLVHFAYPWSLNNQYPFSTTHSTPYFSHYQTKRKLQGIPEIKGNLDAVFVEGVDVDALSEGHSSTRVHLKRGVGKTNLLLASKSINEWLVTWDEGVKIENLFINRKAKVKTQKPIENIIKLKYPITNYRDRFRLVEGQEPSVNSNFYQSFSNKIEERLGTRPRNIFFGLSVSQIQLDGKTSHFSLVDQKVGHKLLYWESTGINQGISVEGKRVQYAKLPLALSQVRPLGIVQYALDLDKYYFYIGLNGEWVVGNPEFSGSGIRLEPNLIYKARGDGLNLGDKPFAYKLPNRYLPYDVNFRKERSNQKRFKGKYQLTKRDFVLVDFNKEKFQRAPQEMKQTYNQLRKAVLEYREKACALTYAYKAEKKVNYRKLDPQCLWYIQAYFEINE